MRIIKSIFKGLGVLIYYIYIIPLFIFVPYFNWQYANKNGFVKWIFLGEIVATGEAIAWPYFIYSKFSSPPEAITSDDPPLNANEMDQLSLITSKAFDEQLSDSDLNNYKQVLRDYSERIGRSYSASNYESIITLNQLLSDYHSELGQSALFSWDSSQYFTTREFDRLYETLKQHDLRRPNKLQDDLEVLKAASRRQDYLLRDGERQKFGREIILEGIKRSEMVRENLNHLAEALREVSNQK